LLGDYFPYFVKERLIRDMTVLKFHGKGQPVSGYIEQVFKTEGFLGYEGSEQQLVDRIVINFHPSILDHAAFIDRPRSLKELYNAVGIMEERCMVSDDAEKGNSFSVFAC
jgi:hypothetical protein